MKLNSISIINFRSILDLTIAFPTFYTAICGRNDAGKTNVLRAMSALMREHQYAFLDRPIEVSPRDDWPKWDSTDAKSRVISITIAFTVYADSDAGLHRFLEDYLNLDKSLEPLSLIVQARYGDGGSVAVSASANGIEQEALKSQEILKKLQSSGAFLSHNSTQILPAIFVDPRRSIFGDASDSDNPTLQKAKARLYIEVQKLAKKQQREIEDLLGRLKQKYKVGVSSPKFDPSQVPFSITLGDDRATVPLEQWGSGTQNRTQILMTLFKARSISQAETSVSKITPILVIEEPESFLHPAGQAEFGALIQDLAEEFKVQVIITSHSPHMLSYRSPNANVLLERRAEKNSLRETLLVSTAGDNWMQPFALSLGIDAELFRPWKDLLFKPQDNVLLVEGPTDKEYFEFLRDIRHGDNRMRFDGTIVAYDGKDTLKAGSILRFIRQRCKHCVLTFDLDAELELASCVQHAGFKKGVDAFPIGLDSPGKQAIEGLVPAHISAKVYGASAELVTLALNGASSDRRKAKNQLKHLILLELKVAPLPDFDSLRDFYSLAKRIDRSFHTLAASSAAAGA